MENEKFEPTETGFESAEIPTEQIEDVVVALDEALQHCRANPDDMSCDCDALHSRICHTEVKRLFEHYEKHEVLTHVDIEQSVGILLAKLEAELEEDPEDEEINKGYKILSERPKEIKLATRRYVRTISKFFHVKKQQMRMSVDEFKDSFEKIDQERRNAHNGLIETLTIYTRTVNELKRYGALDGVEIEEWRPIDRFTDVSDTEGKVFVFAAEVLKNRDLVKDWAVSANMDEKLKQIEEMQKGAQHKPSARYSERIFSE